MVIATALILCNGAALAQDSSYSPPLSSPAYDPGYGEDSLGTSSTSPYSDDLSPPPTGGGSGRSSYSGYRQSASTPTVTPSYRSGTIAEALSDRETVSAWYTRQEYFHWNERIGDADFVNEYGLLSTLGYQKRIGADRFRVEVFGGTMDYVGAAQYDDGTTEPLRSKTGYLGFRGEFELMIEPDWWSQASLFLGVGTRFWFRDLKDGMTETGNPVMGYQEMWWTIYPYLGVETKRNVLGGAELYASSRIGATPVTYEHATWGDAVLYPRCGLTGQVEAGLRGQHFFCAAISEVMTWRNSPVARDALQPNSMFVTVGLKAGIDY